MAQNTATDEAKELADKHKGTSVERENIQGVFEYTVVLEQETVEELPDHMDAQEFAENVAATRMNNELDPTFHITTSDAMATEYESYILNEERQFNVFVRVSQND